MTAVSPRLVQAVVPNNTRAVTGVKRGASSVATSAGGPKAKEVKVYRMQPNNSQTSKKTATTVTPPATTTTTQRTTGAALSNGVRKILINTMDMKDLRTIKIINANTLKHPHLKLAAANLLQQSKQGLLPKNAMLAKEQYERQKPDISFDEEDSSEEQQNDLLFETNTTTAATRDEDDDVEEEEDSDDEDEYGDKYPSSAGRGTTDKLVLTAEERRLLSKEGITLPSNYPLTKHEERELKRIRRKIRNKISAQDSRKRKKEYVDGLEERVKQCTDENQSLMKRIKMLQGQNHSLVTQMKKLQSLLSKTNGGGSNSSNSSNSAQPTTCLMVLLLSMALIAAPNLKLGKREAAGKESELAEAIQESLKMQQNRRNLLYDNLNVAEDEASDSMMVCNEGDFIAENENFIESFYSRIGVGNGNGNNNKKPTAIGGGKKGGSSSFMDLDLDDTVWRSTKKSATVTSGFGVDTATTALNAFSSGANGRNVMMGGLGVSGDAMEKMDNVLIMELRNNLMVGANEQEGIAEDGGKRINNSMHVHVHHQQRGSDILFQD